MDPFTIWISRSQIMFMYGKFSIPADGKLNRHLNKNRVICELFTDNISFRRLSGMKTSSKSGNAHQIMNNNEQ